MREYEEVATRSTAVRQWAYMVGINRQYSEWLLSDYDTWEKNPHYVGPSTGVHPEDDHIPECSVFEDFKSAAAHAITSAKYTGHSVRVEHYNNCCWVVWYN